MTATTSPGRLGGIRRPDTLSTLLVVVLAAAALLAGLVLRSAVEGATGVVDTGELSVRVPARWVLEGTADPRHVTATDPVSSASRLEVRLLDDPGDASSSAAAARLIAEERDRRPGIVVTSDGAAPIAGRESYQVHYRIVGDEAEPATGTLAVFAAGSNLVAVLFEAPADRFAERADILDQAVSSVAIHG